MKQQVFFVGTEAEVDHHAKPLKQLLDYALVEPDDLARRAMPGDLAIFFSEHFDRFREAVQTAKQNQIATLYMVDGILEWRNAWENRTDEPACPFAMRPVLSHKVACIGNSQARVLANWGNAEKVEVVGVPRFDSLACQYVKQLQLDESPATDRLRKGPHRLLVMTAKFPAYTEEQRQLLGKSLGDLKSFLDGRSDIEVTWRLTKGWAEKLGVENQLRDFSGAELSATLDSVDAVISTPSTALLESSLKNLPTAILDYSNSPQYVASVWNITAVDHIEHTVGDMLTRPPRKMFLQQQLLADALHFQSNSAERMRELIVGMLAEAKGCLDAKRELSFPRGMLPAVKAIDPRTLDHEAVFDGFPEFQCDDQLELQAQLAHARREVNHLKSQLNQIQSELSQAHAIFDEINSHPIAGPIVKIRRKLNAMIERLKKPKPNPA